MSSDSSKPRKSLMSYIPLVIRKTVFAFLSSAWLVINMPLDGFYREDWREIWNTLKARKP